MCTDEDCRARQNDNNQSQHRGSCVPVHGPHALRLYVGDNTACSAEFLKWTEVQSCTARHRTALFSNKADLLIQNNLAQKISRESAKYSPDLEHNQIDNIPTSRFLCEGGACHKHLKSILKTISFA